MLEIETALTEALGSDEKLTSNYSRNSLVNHLAGIFVFAESGTVSDKTIKRIREVIFKSFPDDHSFISENSLHSFSMLMDFFLTEDEIFNLMAAKPELVSKAINNNPQEFSSELVKSAAKIYS